MENFGERLKQARERKGMKGAAVASEIGVQPGTLSRWENNEREPNHETTKKLADILGVSVAYLMGETDDPNPPPRYGVSLWGEGEVQRKTDVTDDPAPPREEQESVPRPRQEVESNVTPINVAHMIRINVLPKDYRACCGNGIDWGPEAVDFEAVYDMPLPDLAKRYSDGDVVAVHVEGDSMEPKIRDGDLVLFVPHEKEISYAGIMMVVCYNGRMMVRGLIENGRKQLTLRAKNREYQDIIVTPDDEFTVCGRVVKIHSLSDPESVL